MSTHRQAGETRERIVEAAYYGILEHGIAGATTKRIAKLAGCSEALLYKHFSGKEELVLAVILERMPALAPPLRRLRASLGEGDLTAALAEFAVAAVTFYNSTAPVAAGIVGEPAMLSSFRAMLAESSAGPHMPIVILADHLRQEQRLGRIGPAADPDTLARMLMGVCYHRGHLMYFVDPPDSVEDFAAAVARVVTATP